MTENFTTPETVTYPSKKINKWPLINYLAIAIFIQSLFLFVIFPLWENKRDKQIQIQLVSLENKVNKTKKDVDELKIEMKKVIEDIETIHTAQLTIFKKSADFDILSNDLNNLITEIKEKNITIEKDVKFMSESSRKVNVNKDVSVKPLKDVVPVIVNKEMFKLKDENIIIKDKD